MQRQSTIRRQSRTPDDDIVIKSGYSFCDIVVFAGIICCIISLLAGPLLTGFVAVPLLKEYINIHKNHKETRCSHESASNIVPGRMVKNTNISNETTSYPEYLNSNSSIAGLGNLTFHANMTNHTDYQSPTNKTSPKANIFNCDEIVNYKCKLLFVNYKHGATRIKANFYKSYRHFKKTNSQCSIYGCGLKHSGASLLAELISLKDGFVCYYDKTNTSTVFFRKEPSLGLIVWRTCCSFLLLLGTFPFIACICSKIKTPCQGYFQYCTKRYTSRQEKWIDAIKKGNIFILKWTMLQKHINEELIENVYKDGFKWRAVPLARAAFTGQSHMAEYLLSRGAFTNYEDRLKLTPVYYACLGAQVNTLQLLISQGANVEASDSSNRTPLLTALMLNVSVPDIIQCLLEAGADVSVEDKEKCTPLHYACFKGDLNLVHMIIKAGCVSNSTIYLTRDTFRSNLEGAPFATNLGFKTDLYTNTWTPMTSLLYRNCKEACRLLVSAGYNLKQDPILPRVLYSDADETMNWYIKQQMREVTSLMRICRTWIRGHLGTKKLHEKISQLHLASSIKEYLRLERID